MEVGGWLRAAQSCAVAVNVLDSNDGQPQPISGDAAVNFLSIACSLARAAAV